MDYYLVHSVYLIHNYKEKIKSCTNFQIRVSKIILVRFPFRGSFSIDLDLDQSYIIEIIS